MRKQNNRLELYCMSGMATSPNFLEDFCCELSRLLTMEGLDVTSQLLFPYGDWSRRTAVQIMEIVHDTGLGPSRYSRSIGGCRTAEVIGSSTAGSGVIRVFIGHSGGGVAAAHASRILLQDHVRSHGSRHYIVQIGSPKCALVPEDRTQALYIRLGEHGLRRDPVTRMGSWGGWERAGRGWRWNPQKYAPAYRVSLSMIGGHADYFRRHDPFVTEDGKSNLDKMTECVGSWLLERIRAVQIK